MLVVGAGLCVVVLNESHSITLITSFQIQAFTTATQVGPFVAIGSIADSVTEGEVECRTLYHAIDLGAVKPVFDCRQITVPILSHRIIYCHVRVIHTRVRSRIALGHIVAETSVLQVIEQEFEVSLDNILHVCTLMVQIAHATPVLTGVVVATQRFAVLVCPSKRSAAVIVFTNVGGQHLVSNPFIGLDRKSHPIVDGLAVINHHIGNGADALALERVDHRTQL